MPSSIAGQPLPIPAHMYMHITGRNGSGFQSARDHVAVYGTTVSSVCMRHACEIAVLSVHGMVDPNVCINNGPCVASLLCAIEPLKSSSVSIEKI
jgi:hypothetical protein